MRLKIKNINLFGIKSGREWLVFFTCLLFAFFLWLVHNMSSTYSSYFKYRIKATSYLEGHSESAVSEDFVVISGEASGFSIIQSRLSVSHQALDVKIDSKYLKPYDGIELFYVTGNDIKSEISAVLKDRVSVSAVLTDTIFFRFPRQTSKKVPVVFRSNIEYAPQYMPLGNFNLTPDSVTVYGDVALLEKTDSVYTELITVKNRSKSIQGVCAIEPIRGLRYSDKDIYFTQTIERYVEKRIMVPVNVINVPEHRKMLVIPSEVQVRFRQQFSVRKDPVPSDFLITVDYNEYERNEGLHYVLKAEMMPDYVFSVEIHPRTVECIVR